MHKLCTSFVEDNHPAIIKYNSKKSTNPAKEVASMRQREKLFKVSDEIHHLIYHRDRVKRISKHQLTRNCNLISCVYQKIMRIHNTSSN